MKSMQGDLPVFIVGFLLWRGIRNVGGDHYIYKAAVADLEILRRVSAWEKVAAPAWLEDQKIINIHYWAVTSAGYYNWGRKFWILFVLIIRLNLWAFLVKKPQSNWCSVAATKSLTTLGGESEILEGGVSLSRVIVLLEYLNCEFSILWLPSIL